MSNDNTALGACKQETIIDRLKDKIRVLLQSATTIESQMYLIQLALFGKYKTEGESKKEITLSETGLFARWDTELGDALKHLRVAQEDVKYMMEELNISEPPKEVK